MGHEQSPTRPCHRPDANRGLAIPIVEALGIDKQAVYKWKRVPGTPVLDVSPLIGMPPEEIRSDIFKR